ncbi:HEPN domain-containing protein [Candidatus Woesearchaeota archaeon]|nr:HEPN domain-containing protein [Candidatus Woesearchaeota archaeon]
MDSKQQIKEDLERAEKALQSAERNFDEKDMFTSANRLFVACESAIYALLKLKYGSISMSRERILTRLKDVDAHMKEIYDLSYDLRVQADYGRQSKIKPLTEQNVKFILNEVTQIIQKVKDIIETSMP